MSLEEIKVANKNNFLNPLPDEVEKFKEIFEDFEREISIQYGINTWSEAKFFDGEDFIGYFLYEIKNGILQLNEIASSNMSDYESQIANEKFVGDFKLLSMMKKSYIGIFMMKKLVDLAKQNNINKIKISGVLDNSLKFYGKVANLFIKMGIIKSTSGVRIEKEDFWATFRKSV